MVKLKNIIIHLILLCVFSGCNRNNDCVFINNLCVFGYEKKATEKEVAYVKHIVSIMNQLNNLNGWDIVVYDDARKLSQAMGLDYTKGGKNCLKGRIFPTEKLILSLPSALPHEIVHASIWFETNGKYFGRSHNHDTKWEKNRNDQLLYIRNLDIKKPNKDEKFCFDQNRKNRKK